MFPINPAALPSLQTRQALLVIDLQNDFVSADGALPVEGPDGLVDRILEVARAFRDSGSGDVVWVRSQFEAHRPLDGEPILVASDPQLAVETRVGAVAGGRPLPPYRTTAAARGRQPVSRRHDQAMLEAHEEAFLSAAPAGHAKPACVRAGTAGARLAPRVEAAVDAARDVVLTKTHYSAFAASASGPPPLLQLLRGRFVTQLYVCGALTNVSIYATALDAGQHGYELTLVEDCCGYRGDGAGRHAAAVRRLVHLTGCEVKTARDVIAQIGPSRAAPPREADREAPPREHDREAPPPRRSSVSQLSSAIDQWTLRDSSSPPPPPSSSSSAGRRPPKGTPPAAAATQPLRSPATTAVAVEPRHGPTKAPSDAPAPVTHAPRAAAAAAARSHPDPGSKSPASPSGDASRSDSSQGAASRASAARKKSSSEDRPETSESRGRHHRTNPPSSTTTTTTTTTMDRQPSTSAATVSEPLCEGDTTIVYNVLPPDLAADAFARLQAEVQWQRMSHQGGEVPRLVAVQGEVGEDGSMPVYRHPADESPPLRPFSPTVLAIKREVETHLGHPLNHVLIQRYRGGHDYISEHSDKTLDIVRGSFIANVSLGAERTMVFRTKRADPDRRSRGRTADAAAADRGPAAGATAADQEALAPAAGPSTPPRDDERRRQTQRAALPHNSLCRMGLATNRRWLHSIRPDKRPARERSAAERAYGGERISLTFRQIGTFLDAAQTRIWGQGATGKTRAAARPVVNGQTAAAVAMLRAFGAENHSGGSFDWAAHYGAGFDVLHLSAAPRWFAGPDDVANARVALLLADLNLACARGSTGGAAADAVRFVDSDAERSTAEGQAAVLLYLDAAYGGARRHEPAAPRHELARRFTRLQQGLGLLDRWRALQQQLQQQQQRAGGGDHNDEDGESTAEAAAAAPGGGGGAETKMSGRALLKPLRRELAVWDGYAREASEAAAAAAAAASGRGKDKAGEADGATAAYIAGGRDRASIADYAVWPVLHDMARACCGGDGGAHFFDATLQLKHLGAYYRLMRQSRAAVQVYGPAGDEREERTQSGSGDDAEEGKGDASAAEAPASAGTGSDEDGSSASADE